MTLTIGPRLRGFFGEVLPTIVATVNERGVPELTPIWYEFVDGQILLNGDATRIWLRRMEETGRVTLFVIDPVNDWRWVQVYGRVVEARSDANGDHINRLAHRYRGRDYTGDRSRRRTLAIEITSVKGADGARTVPWDAEHEPVDDA